MSFSSNAKEELCRLEWEDRSAALAEASGVLLYGNAFTSEGIRISTGFDPFARRLGRLFKRAFGFGFDRETGGEGSRYVLEISDPEKLERVFDECGGDRSRFLAHHVNLGILEEQAERQSFLRGAFLSGGSVSDPAKSYHLEMVTHHYSVSRETVSLLRDMGFDPGETARGGNFLLYFKKSEAISEFLTTAGAPLAGMEVINARIEKSIAEKVNRRLNCDGANIDKTVEASERQLRAIRLLREAGRLDDLGEKLKYTALLREANPELSLTQLAEMMDPPVSKSSLSYRLRRLTELAGVGEEQ